MPASLDWQDWRLETHDRELKKHNRELHWELKEQSAHFPEQDRSSTISASAISVLHAADTNKSPEGPIAHRIHTAGSPSSSKMMVAPIGDSHLVQALSSSAAGALPALMPALTTFAKPFASPSPVHMPALTSTVVLSGWARYSNSANDGELRSAMEDIAALPSAIDAGWLVIIIVGIVGLVVLALLCVYCTYGRAPSNSKRDGDLIADPLRS